ncbi:hypothetical protein F5Y12DRAFT_790113 [Xylaria sp. FL1777]|nr:hypothetical protein F5Y12DRAFT_790113 [Xylaria sp. FL1777]
MTDYCIQNRVSMTQFQALTTALVIAPNSYITRKLDDVKLAIEQIEKQLAARQRLRNIQRITPFIDAVERYSKAVEILANGTPLLPWIWAVHEYTHALDTILTAYGDIGRNMPRLARFAEVFPQDRSVQQLIALLFEDILEFHRRAYSLTKKPGWKMFFRSAWGGFDHRFGSLLQSISRTSEQIDREVMSINIMELSEYRKRSSDEALNRETQWRTQQLNFVLDWLGATDTDQEIKLDWLNSRCLEGTSQWALKSLKLRAWLQRGRGSSVTWLYGKPGSGKSVLASQLIRFLRTDNSSIVCFFFCDFHTPTLGVTASILSAFCAQIIRHIPDFAPYLYNEYISRGLRPSAGNITRALVELFGQADNVRLIVDGIDEISISEHKSLIKTLQSLTASGDKCKLLIISQDLPSISCQLLRRPHLSMAEEQELVQKDLAAIVEGSLSSINEKHDKALEEPIIMELKSKILQKAEGMFLWVHLVLSLLENAPSIQDLRLQIDTLPIDLATAYERILTGICSRCSMNDIARLRRIFSWLIYHKGQHPLKKHEVRLAMSLYPGQEALNADTKPFANATDICKPLVEDGPGGSLVLIHSTVAIFLCQYSDTPFIRAVDAHESISYACMSQLCQGLDLLEPSKKTDATINIAFCFYSLLPYAHEHWVAHFIAFVNGSKAIIHAESNHVFKLAQRFCDKVRFYSMGNANGPPNSALDEIEDPSIVNLASVMDVSVVQSTILSRNAGFESPEVTFPLSRAMRFYQETLRNLVKQQTVVGLSDKDLMRFKEEYAPSALICDKSGCDRALHGFPSEKTLKDHRSRHDGALKCYEKDCAYNDIGFVSGSSLAAHKRKRHQDPQPAVVPKRIRDESSLLSVLWQWVKIKGLDMAA